MATTTISIRGMSCGHCVSSVKAALGALDGVAVEEVQVGSARVTYDAQATTPGQIAAAVEDAGYPAQVAGG